MSQERGQWTGLNFEQGKAAVEVIGGIGEDWDAGMQEILPEAYKERASRIPAGGIRPLVPPPPQRRKHVVC